MSWQRSFRFREYVRGSLWIVPLIGALLGSALGALDVVVERHVTVPLSWQYSPSTASTVLAAIAGAMAALAGFVVTVTVLVVQMATVTFSPRYMRLWYRDRMLKLVLAVLVGSLTFSFSLLRHVSATNVPNLGVTTAGALVVVALLLFLLFLDRFVHRLRPVAVGSLAARAGRDAFLGLVRDASPGGDELRLPPGEPAVVVRATAAGAIQAVHTPGLVAWARERGCLVVLRQTVGDFVFDGASVMDVYGEVDDAAAARTELRGMVALGIERTTEQDPAFAIRVLVDIAIRALSPAVNDPTTAVQILNHLGELLKTIGDSDLVGRFEHRDGEGSLRVILPVQRWEDFLSLAVTEIRQFGGPSVQVLRRLRAVLEGLRESVRPEHRPAVEAELARLDRTVTDFFGESIDLDLAVGTDAQGLGGAPAAAPAPVLE